MPLPEQMSTGDADEAEHKDAIADVAEEVAEPEAQSRPGPRRRHCPSASDWYRPVRSKCAKAANIAPARTYSQCRSIIG